MSVSPPLVKRGCANWHCMLGALLGAWNPTRRSDALGRGGDDLLSESGAGSKACSTLRLCDLAGTNLIGIYNYTVSLGA